MRRVDVAAGALVLAARCLTAQDSTRAKPTFVDGLAQVVPAFADSSTWVRQDLWVETGFDSDQDGKPDRVHVDVTRPPQTDHGLKVAVIYGSSPYYAGVSRDQVDWDVRQELNAQPKRRGLMLSAPYDGSRTRISNEMVNDWVPRGFAVVHSEAPGTGRSQGCPTVGDTPERTAMQYVIDWLNGRAKGYTTETGSEEVKATWSTGKVGMMGTSYEGTLPLAAATTGVDGLDVVIPVSPNTSYYHYYRSNGLVRSPGGYLGEDVDVLYDFIASGDTAERATCERLYKNGVFAKGQDRATGDYNDFWAKRDLLPWVQHIKAAVLLAHGLNDYNVVSEHSVRIYNEMKKDGLPVSLYLHQGGHGGNPPADMVNRWFSHYLYGVDNGVQRDPPVWIVQDSGSQAPAAIIASAKAAQDSARRAEGSSGETTAIAAPAGRRGRRRPAGPPTPFASFPVPGSSAVTFYPGGSGTAVGTLAFSAAPNGKSMLVDDVSSSGSADASAARSTHRLLYASPVLTDTVHISGTPRVTVRIASSKPAANLSVWLVMLPYDSTDVGSQSHAGLISRGWADPQNYKSLTAGGNYDSEQPGETLVPGTFYDLTFDLEPDDEFVPAGKRFALMIMSSDREFTLWPAPGTELTVDLSHSSVSIPVVGGRAALEAAGMP